MLRKDSFQKPEQTRRVCRTIVFAIPGPFHIWGGVYGKEKWSPHVIVYVLCCVCCWNTVGGDLLRGYVLQPATRFNTEIDVTIASCLGRSVSHSSGFNFPPSVSSFPIFFFLVGSRIFTSPSRPDRLWGPPNLLYNGYRGLFPGGKAAGAWSWPLTSN
jgi:hypothetical protein